MSEYQYYEFQAIDRRLTARERETLRSYSTRATITPTSFTNEYVGGDFNGDEMVWMERYFDGLLYFANWGSRRLRLRFDVRKLDAENAKTYLCGEYSGVHLTADKLILTFAIELESGGGVWFQGGEQLSLFLPLREELTQGDLRSLYIGWLSDQKGVYREDFDKIFEPPRPAGLHALTDAQKYLCEFLMIDEDLLAAAAEGSPPREDENAPRHDELLAWLAKLPTLEKDELLARLITPSSALPDVSLYQRYLQERQDQSPKKEKENTPCRSLATLLHEADLRKERRERVAAAEAEEQNKATQFAREQRLNSIEGHVDKLWSDIETLALSKLPESYDQVIELLTDLHDLAVRQGDQPAFQALLKNFRARHRYKPSLLRRIRRRNLSSIER